MRGLPPKTFPLRVAVLGDYALVEALSEHADQMILSPVETNLEISARVTQADVLVVDVTTTLEVPRELSRREQVGSAVGSSAPGGKILATRCLTTAAFGSPTSVLTAT